MSERRGTPTGLPASTDIFQLNQFEGMNEQTSRASIGDQEAWILNNLMPIAPMYLRAMPDNGASIYSTNRWNVALAEAANAQDTIAVGRVPRVISSFQSNSGLTLVWNSGSISPSVSTTGANQFIVICVCSLTDHRAPTNIATINDTSGLTWHSRNTAGITYPTGASTNSFSFDCYYALAASVVTNITISWTFNSYCYSWAACGMVVSGVDTAAPFDTHAPTVATGAANGGICNIPSVGAATTLSPNLLFTCLCAGQGLGDRTITEISGGLNPCGADTGFFVGWPRCSWLTQTQSAPPFLSNVGSSMSMQTQLQLMPLAATTLIWDRLVDSVSTGWIFYSDSLTGS